MPFFDIDVFSLLTTVFWVWMLVDCLFNKQARGGNKVFWFLFILFTHFFGAIIYFFMKCTMRNPAEALAYYVRSFKQAFQPAGTPPQPPYQSRQQQQSWRPSQSQPHPPQPPPAYPYSNYAQGYQYQPPQPAERAQPQPYEPRPASTPEPEYEQTMISYPEMPPQQ